VAARRGETGIGSTGERKRGGYVADPTWQEAVRKKLAADGVTEKAFAKKVGCAQSTLHDTLHVAYKSSHLIPKINKLLKWELPQKLPRESSPPLPSADAIEAAMMFDALPEDLRRAKIAELRATYAQFAAKKAND
jgi:hypothetical protein